MNVKYDNDRQKMQRNMKNYGNPNMPYGPPPTNPYQPYPQQMQRPPYGNYYPQMNNIPPMQSNQRDNPSEKVIGQKPCNILVR